MLPPQVAIGDDAAPANTLAGMGRQFSACMGGHPLGPAGSQITIAFAMRANGTILGKPRITFSHLEGDSQTKGRFLAAVEQAVDSCLPLKVTLSLGGAIAGRVFTITLGRPSPSL